MRTSAVAEPGGSRPAPAVGDCPVAAVLSFWPMSMSSLVYLWADAGSAAFGRRRSAVGFTFPSSVPTSLRDKGQCLDFWELWESTKPVRCAHIVSADLHRSPFTHTDCPPALEPYRSRCLHNFHHALDRCSLLAHQAAHLPSLCRARTDSSAASDDDGTSSPAASERLRGYTTPPTAPPVPAAARRASFPSALSCAVNDR